LFSACCLLLTSITIMLSIPVIVSSFYGMNVTLPFMKFAHAFWIVIAIAVAGIIGFFLVFWRKRYF